MSVISALGNMGRVRSVEEAWKVKDCTTTAMKEALGRWTALYYTGVVDAAQEDSCQRLAVTVVNKLAKTTFSEYAADMNASGKKADWLAGLLEQVNTQRLRMAAMQHCLMAGESLLKPAVTADKGMTLTAVRRGGFLPVERREDGTLVDAVFTHMATQGTTYYTLLERQRLAGEDLQIQYRLYSSTNKDLLGSPVPLGTLPQFAALQPDFVLKGIGGLGVVQLRCPVSNCVDDSADAVSVYAAAADLIQRVNRNEWQLCREFELGRSRVIATEDILQRDRKGNPVFEDDLFATVDDSTDNVGVTIFSPELRVESYHQRKNEYLRNIETVIGLKRGILSEVEAVERTAKEITSSEGDYNLTILDLQLVWETALRELVSLCDRLGQAYGLCDSSRFDPQKGLVVEWGNGVLYDEDKEWERQMQMVQAGMLKPELALAWKYNLPCKTPEELAKIQEWYLPVVERLVAGGE